MYFSALRAAYRTAISAAQILVIIVFNNFVEGDPVGNAPGGWYERRSGLPSDENV